MQIQTNVSPTAVGKTYPKQAATVATAAEASAPAPSTDAVSLSSYDKIAIKAEEAQLAGHAKIGAIAGGLVGVVAGAAAGFVGGAVGALVGLTAAPAGALMGAATMGAAGFMLATHKREGSLALIGGILAASAGAVLGGVGGFYGGAALGAAAGAAGGVAGSLAGALGLGTLGAGAGALGKVLHEVVGNKDKYPNVIARFKEDQAREAEKQAG